MSESTPGPWRRGQVGNMRIYGPDGMGAQSGPVADTMHRMTSGEQQANARLIAQAWTIPALREALEAIVAADDGAIAEMEAMGLGNIPRETRALTEQARAALKLGQEND